MSQVQRDPHVSLPDTEGNICTCGKIRRKKVTLLARKCSYPWTRVGQEKKLQACQLPEKAQSSNEDKKKKML